MSHRAIAAVLARTDLSMGERLVARGLVAIEEVGRGRGHATTLTALFAQFGPWWDGEINARLLEHVLTQSPARGPERHACSPSTPLIS